MKKKFFFFFLCDTLINLIVRPRHYIIDLFIFTKESLKYAIPLIVIIVQNQLQLLYEITHKEICTEN